MSPTATRVLVGLAGVVAAASTVLGLVAGSLHVVLLAFSLIALAAAAYLGLYVTPALLISLGLAAEVLNGNAARVGFPIAPDRILIFAGLASLALKLPGAVVTRSIVWRPVHALLAATAAYGTVSALAAHTLTTSDGVFALLDRLGILPFLVFTLAPLIFGTKRSRNTLLVVLVGLGAYLGITALAEGIGLDWLIFPSYIKDPSIGLHFGRARGPFAEAVANGLGLYGCAVASATASWLWRDRRLPSRLAMAVTILCLAGTIFTLTRAIWLATIVATLVALLANHRTRSILAPTIAVGLTVLTVAILFVPGFADHAEQRQDAKSPIWDRYNSNSAAIRAIKDEPLFGVGWATWIDRNSKYLRQSPDYPLTGTHIQIHNVVLSQAAELGLIGLALWGAAFLAGIGGAILRPGPSELDPWRLGLIALAVHWVIVASFGPLAYPFPNLLLWLWAGLCSVGHLSTPERPEAVIDLREPAPAPA